MTVWSDEELFGLQDFDFGVSTGWSMTREKKLVRRFETPNLIADAVAVAGGGIRFRGERTTILFEADQILPDMLALQNKMEEAGWPSRKKDPQLYALWNKARTAQAKIFKGLISQMQQESPEFAKVLDGRGGWLNARGTQDPQLWREPLIIPVALFNQALPMWVTIITIHKRPGELDVGNI